MLQAHREGVRRVRSHLPQAPKVHFLLTKDLKQSDLAMLCLQCNYKNIINIAQLGSF